MSLNVVVGSRIRILTSRNPARIGQLATIIGPRRVGRSAVTGQPNYVHPVDVDGVGPTANGKPIAVEDGTFELVSGEAHIVKDDMSPAYAWKLATTGQADGIVGKDGIVRLDEESP